MRTPRDRLVRLPGGGGPVRVREWGSGSRAVLLLHGFMGGVEEWDDLSAALEECRVVALDLPGHGASPGPPDPDRYRIPRIARDVGRVQEAMFGEPAVWVGYSMGGRIALAAAVQGIPMRSLLLEGASPGLRTHAERQERREQDEERARRIEGDGMDRFVSWWLELPLFRGLDRVPEPVRDKARRLRAGQDPGCMAAWLRGGGTGSQPSYWSALPELQLPVRLLVGEDDVRYRRTAAEMARLLPDGEVTVAPGSGHLPHLEAPDAWLDTVRRTLEVRD